MEIIYLANPNSPYAMAGVAFIINKKCLAPKQWSAHELIPGRALFLKIKWHESESTSLVNIYVPTHKPRHLAFWTKICDEHTAQNLMLPDFMLGNFNMIEDPIDRAPAHPDDHTTAAALRDLQIAWGLQDAWQLLYLHDLAYTYCTMAGDQQTQLRLDCIYIKNTLVPLTFNWKIEQAPVPTDHWLVKVKYTPADASFIGKRWWTWPLHMLDNDQLLEAVSEWGIKLQEDLNHLRSHNTERTTSNPQLLWKDFKKDISMIAKKHTCNSYHKLGSHINHLEKD